METYFVETQQTNYVSHLRFWDCWSRNLVTPDTTKNELTGISLPLAKLNVLFLTLVFLKMLKQLKQTSFKFK